MRVVVITCDGYADALPAYHALFAKFWPDCQYRQTIISDSSDRPENWCRTLVSGLDAISDEFILLMQEDFFLTHPVELDLINGALEILKVEPNIGCIRLFPCPGAVGGKNAFGFVERNEAYRTSLQASIWRKDYLRAVAELSTGGRAADFELEGGPEAARLLPGRVMAFRRDQYPWPIQYMCSAITRSQWEPAAKTLCEAHGVSVDWSKRPFRVLTPQ